MKISDISLEPGTDKKLIVAWESGRIKNLNLELFEGRILDKCITILPKIKK